MNYDEVVLNARKKMNLCRGCKQCNGIVCAGETPGSGGVGSGSSFIRNVAKLKEVTCLMNPIHINKYVSTETDFFGKKVSLPVYVAPIGAIDVNYGTTMSEADYAKALVNGVGNDSIVFCGDGPRVEKYVDQLAALKEGWGVPTIKPWRQVTYLQRLALASEINCHALCIDIDAAGLLSLRKLAEGVEFKDVDALKEMIETAKAPVILKGIMTKQAALQAIEAKASGIVVSNHGGRVLDDSPATIEVLKEICEAVDHRIMVLIDGGFRSGSDVFKALALGADGVLIGRPFSIAAIGEGEAGVRCYLQKIQSELQATMEMCGCETISDINQECIKCTF